MTTTEEAPAPPETILPLRRSVKILTVLLAVAVLLIVAMATLGLFGWRKIKAMEKTEDDIQFNQFVSDLNTNGDAVTPTVNVIQFLHHGYSIDFDSVQYTQNGLVLSGQLGNPTNLWITSLALNMTARPYPYMLRDKWKAKQGEFFWVDTEDIGHAETVVPLLNPGSTANFQITIPNVKQTTDGFQIAVSFSGERYQYLGK